jgi:hypothetical protein
MSGVYGNGRSYAYKQATARLVGGRVTRWLSRRVAVEGSVGYATSEVSGGSNAFAVTGGVSSGPSAYAVTGGVSLLVSVKPRASGASVYFTGGVGAVAHGGDVYVNFVGTTGWGPVVGVGARWRAGPSLAIRAGLEDYLYNFSPHDPSGVAEGPTGTHFQNDLVISLGLSVRLPPSRSAQ